MMRKAVILLVVAGLLLWNAAVMAFSRPIAREWDGDPDEFQSRAVHDEFSTKVICPVSGMYREPALARIKKLDAGYRPNDGPRITINLSGRIFLER
jgi:hypothetical protein